MDDKERIQMAVTLANDLSYQHTVEGKIKHTLYDMAHRLGRRSVHRKGFTWYDNAGSSRRATLFEVFAHRVAGLVPQTLV